MGTTHLHPREQFPPGMLRSEKTLETKARECFRRTTELDPNFVRAHAGLGQSPIFRDPVLANCPMAASADAEAVIRRALTLDPKCGGAWTAMGSLRMSYGAGFRETEPWVRRTIELLNSDHSPGSDLSRCPAGRGRTRDALEV